jgi:predicted AlkP superfamily phosphohydrolase/phosphomutase
MPEDTAALSSGVFVDSEYREQATFVLKERLRLFEHELNRFRTGFLYFYFSSLDLDSHMFWRCVDEKHPLHSPQLVMRHGDFLPWLYGKIDQALGQVLPLIDDRSLLLVCSDHGFQPFRRQFNLNSWLMDYGYARPKNRSDRGQADFFANTDWTATKAYGVGINGLYVNLKGREPDGIVEPGEPYETLRSELIERLTAVKDPQTGEPVMVAVHRPEDIYSGPCLDTAPDLLVCYNRYHRASWDTILGKYPREHVLDNLDPWSGDHCMDARFLPGVLLANRPIRVPDPHLIDLAPSILHGFGIDPPAEMTGRNILA